MKTLVTGSAGFIGFHLSRFLLERGDAVVGLDNFCPYYSVQLKEDRNKILETYKNYKVVRCDLRDLEKIQNTLQAEKVDRVCNLAAQAGVRHSITHPHDYVNSNLLGFINILEACRHAKVERLVYASSSSVYGGNTKLPFSESDRIDTPLNLYAATKKADELLAHAYSHLYNMQTIGLRFFSVYGPMGRPDMAMWIFIKSIIEGKPIEIYNNGDMERDFTYVDDIVKGVVATLDKEGLPKYEIYNLGNHRSEKLLETIDIIESEVGKKAIRKLLPMQPGDVRATYADIAKAKNQLGFEPATSIREGIPRFVKWYKEYHGIK